MIRFELKRMLTSKMLLLGAFILCLSLLSYVWRDILYSETEDLLCMYELGWALSAALLIVPVVSLISYGVSHFNDESTGYSSLMITRSGLQNYITIKFIVAFLSGFIMIVLTAILFSTIVVIIRPEALYITETSAIYGDFWNAVIEKGGGWLFFLIKIFMMGCFAGICSAMGMALSPYLKNKYIVFAAPFFVCELLSTATEYLGLYLLKPYNIPLRNSIGRLAFGGLPYALCYIGMLLLGLYLLFDHGIRRKRVHG